MKKIKFSKKADINISLSWVFMIIIGGFFIILSYNIIDKYQSNEQAKFEIEVRQALRELLNNVGRTSGTEENSIENLGNIFTDSRVEIICEANRPILSINENLDANNDFLKNYPTFMTFIEESKVSFSYLAVENFKLPFKITNMLAIVSEKNLIVFDNSSDSTEDILEKFDVGSYSKLNYVVRDLQNLDSNEFWNEFSDQNLDSVVFVSDNDDKYIINNVDEIKTLVNQILIEQTSDYYGILYYIDSEGNKIPYKYLDYYDKDFQDPRLNLVTMAIFSNPDTYDCSYNLLQENLVGVYDFYINKTEDLIERSKVERTCSSNLIVDSGGIFNGDFQVKLYEDLRDALIKTRDHLEIDKFNKNEILTANINLIELTSEQLEEYNCAYVY